MNEDQIRELLRKGIDDIRVGPPPTDQLVSRGGRPAWLRHGLPAFATAMAVAIVLVGVFSLRLFSAGTDQAADPPKGNASQAPAATRLVGMGSVAVAVPEDWATNDLHCETPMSDTVVFRSEGTRLCSVVPAPVVSSLEIVATWSDWAQPWLRQAQPAGEVDGVPVERVATRSTPSGTAIGALVIKSEDVVFSVTSPDASTVDAILDSLVVLPESYVTVPYDPNGPTASTRQRMLDAGLEVKVQEEHRPGLSAGVLLDTEPELGSVVPVGSTVTLMVSGGSQEDPARVTPCQQVPIVPVGKTEMDTVMDEAAGQLLFSYSDPDGGDQRTYLIDYRKDQACLERPDLRRLIEHVLRSKPLHSVPILPSERQLLKDLYRFAKSPTSESASEVPFGPEVALGLGNEVIKRLPRSRLADASSWRLNVEYFRAYVGPFSALDLLADSNGAYRLSVGRHPSCVGPPVPTPSTLAGLRQISAQPRSTSSCLAWWSVDVFVDGAGDVRGVTMDLYEP